jgi:uncharacterized protein
MKIASKFLAGVAAIGFLVGARAGERSMEPLTAFPQALLSVRTAAGNVHQFNVWIADRESRQEQGLMFVRKLEPHQGMLFVYAEDRQLSMWMKNTLIPLDMLFIRADGTISHIGARTTPQSLDIIAAPQPVRAVLELDGGTSELLGIRTGDRVFCDALDKHPPGAPGR